MNVQTLAAKTFHDGVDGGDMGALASLSSEQLNVNLVAWDADGGVGLHANDVVDVVLIVLSGTGMLTVNDTCVQLEVGTVAMIPRGATRSVTAVTRLVYVTVHRARPALMPSKQTAP